MPHTPGPWRVEDIRDFDTFEFDIKAGDFYVAAIPDVPGQTEANARLIAAAPELLCAGDALWDAVGTYFETAMIPDSVCDAIQGWIDARTKTVHIS